jgi:hypothetical protein
LKDSSHLDYCGIFQFQDSIAPHLLILEKLSCVNDANLFVEELTRVIVWEALLLFVGEGVFKEFFFLITRFDCVSRFKVILFMI